jgi:hypothetical protein
VYKIRKKGGTKFVWVMLVTLLAMFVVVALRVLSTGGEDNWICLNGRWVEHGKPSSPMPTAVCK